MFFSQFLCSDSTYSWQRTALVLYWLHQNWFSYHPGQLQCYNEGWCVEDKVIAAEHCRLKELNRAMKWESRALRGGRQNNRSYLISLCATHLANMKNSWQIIPHLFSLYTVNAKCVWLLTSSSNEAVQEHTLRKKTMAGALSVSFF